VLIGREKTDIADIDMVVGWKLQSAAGTVVGEKERENWRDVSESEIQLDDHCNQLNGEK
jgi:hypothetical protein